jgi:hypothetical protein
VEFAVLLLLVWAVLWWLWTMLGMVAWLIRRVANRHPARHSIHVTVTRLDTTP